MSSSSNDLVDDLVGDYMRSVIPEDVISSNNDFVDDLVGDYMRSDIPEDVISSNNDLVDDLVGDYMRSVIPEDVISSNNDQKGLFQFFSVPFIHSPVLQVARPCKAF